MRVPKNLGELFLNTAKNYPHKAAFLYKSGRRYEPIPWVEAVGQIKRLANAFLAAGLKRQDRLAILCENRPEWAMIDLAAQWVGIVTVPLYSSLTSSEVEFILEDSAASLVVVSDKNQLEKIISVCKRLPSLQCVLALDASLALSQGQLPIRLMLWKDIENFPLSAEAERLADEVASEALASIIYTSGTTGDPKGVMLTHDNFIHNVIGCREAFKMSHRDTHLSFLPLCHVFERTVGYYLMIYIGATIAYAEDMDSVPQNMLEVRPTFLSGVPRFYEKVMARVLEAVKNADPVRKALFLWAKEIGEAKRTGKAKRGPLFFLEQKLADWLVGGAFRRRLGGRVRFCVSGGAAISVDVLDFFYDLGVMVYEGYGLTETSPVISANRVGQCRFGTIGTPIQGVEVKVSAEGELLTRSRSVMKGYYRRPEETAAAFEDGWFRTGDLARLDPDRFITITGRKKELIVTSGGKKISPAPIEELLARDPYIQRCVLFGEAKKFITAFIVPRKKELMEYAAVQKISFESYNELLIDPRIYNFIDLRIQSAMAGFASYEKIKYFAFLSHDFAQEAGELTPTLKIKRSVIISRYKDLLLPFYTDKYCKDNYERRPI